MALPIGVQVYSIRDDAEQDFAGTMRKVKEMGYDGVELAGLYGHAPEYIKGVLDAVGLVPISAHVPLVDMMADAEQVASDYEKIGVKFIAVPYLPAEYRHLTPGYETVISEIKRIAAVLKAHGITTLYHNHDFEFVTLPDGTFGLDDIYTQIPADLLQTELDTCWVNVAGQSPDGYVRKYTGRAPIVHLKDFYKEGKPKNLYKLIGITTEEEKEETGIFEFRPVGSGVQDWKAILDASVAAGAGWVVVEQDEPSMGLSRLDSIKKSIDYIKTINW